MGFTYSKNEAKLVAKGAKLLDKILPGWHRQVDLDKLNMQSGTMCMMGQLFGNGVEGALAKEMYPEELKARKKELGGRWGMPQKQVNGYHLGLNDLGGPSVVEQLIKKNGLTRKFERTEADAEFEALRHVCNGGHDTKCLWADEVASRVAADGEAKK